MDATIDVLLCEGYDRMSIEVVATTAGVGKATIYRRWKDKASLTIDALARIRPEDVAIDTGALDSDISELIAAWSSPSSQRQQRVFINICSALPREPDLHRAFREWHVDPLFASVADVLVRAQDRGEIGSDVDVRLAAEIVPSLLWQHAAFEARPDCRDQVDRLVSNILMPALGLPSARPDHPRARVLALLAETT